MAAVNGNVRRMVGMIRIFFVPFREIESPHDHDALKGICRESRDSGGRGGQPPERRNRGKTQAYPWCVIWVLTWP
jgi:hypothetical protein